MARIKLIADRWAWELVPLKVGREPEQIQAQQGGLHGNPMNMNHPYMKQATGIVTRKTSPPYKWGRVGAGVCKDLLNLHCQRESTKKTHKASNKTLPKLQRSPTLKEKALNWISTGSTLPKLQLDHLTFIWISIILAKCNLGEIDHMPYH